MYYNINQNIRAKEVRLIGEDGKQVGVVPIEEALKRAKKAELDLVEVSTSVKPPVVKILDFKRFLLERKQQEKTARKKSVKAGLKELRLRPNIGGGDLAVRIKRAEEFLRAGDRVKVTVLYRGREASHPEVGLEKINRMITSLKEVGRAEEKPKRRGNMIDVTFVPLGKEGNKNDQEKVQS